MQNKIDKPEYDIIKIIFKCCVSKMYLIVMLPNIKCTYDQISLINKNN